MQYNFCTLFDKNYLYKGLTLYNSIVKNCNNFKLWILCMDKITFEILQKMELTNTELIPLDKIEDKKLLSVKKERNAGEYSWTCKPYLLIHILNNYKNLETITYLDSDLFFFSSPDAIYKEFNNNSIMLTPQRFPKEKKHYEKTKGKYNAGVIILKNNKTTKNCLNWWRKRCLEWCYHRYEDGKLGDQMYLEKWKKLFPITHDIKNIGANLAPWNLLQYNIKKTDNQVSINDTPLVLFHFHALQILSSSKFNPSPGYNIPRHIQQAIYAPYFDILKKNIEKIKLINKNFNFGFSKPPNFFNKTKNYVKKVLK